MAPASATHFGAKQPLLSGGEARAGRGNRTLLASLEGWSFTTKLYPRGGNIERRSRTRQGRNGGVDSGNWRNGRARLPLFLFFFIFIFIYSGPAGDEDEDEENEEDVMCACVASMAY